MISRMRCGSSKDKLTYSPGQERLASPRHARSTHSIDRLFGAVCLELGTGAALVLPACNAEAMQLQTKSPSGSLPAPMHFSSSIDDQRLDPARSWALASAKSQAQQAARVRVQGSPIRRNRIVVRRQRRDSSISRLEARSAREGACAAILNDKATRHAGLRPKRDG